MNRRVFTSWRGAGFTLVELMVSTAIIALLMVILVDVTGQTSTIWRYTTAKTEQFRESRAAFDTLTTRLSQATLNTYWDYGYDKSGLPTRYERRSELRFIAGPAKTLLGDSADGAKRITHTVFFHAALGLTDTSVTPTATQPGYRGLENLLNVWGYFVELGDDRRLRPPFVTTGIQPYRTRFRLMECMQPSEKLQSYNYTSGVKSNIPSSTSYVGTDWFAGFINKPDAPVHALAENIVALIITPRLSKTEESAKGGGAVDTGYSPLAPTYAYDSTKSVADKDVNPKNQLPPVVQITMVAIDEVSASRLNLDQGSSDLLKLSTKFSDTKNYTNDLALDPTRGEDDSLENKLVALKCSYRVFTTNVPIRAAKWSREQQN